MSEDDSGKISTTLQFLTKETRISPYFEEVAVNEMKISVLK